MCGICGFVDMDMDITAGLLREMNNIVRYRGPDDEGYFLSDGIENDSYCGGDTVKELKNLIHINRVESKKFCIGLAHRRLSIIDLSFSGHQPMIDKDKGISIVFNGEIYNYIELRDELKGYGCVFDSDTDTEVIIKAYSVWGEKCVERFNGMWAFALWDSVKCKFLCSRDRLGAKPFYYYKEGEKFLFASELKQICQDSRIDRCLNIKSVVNYIMWGVTDYDENTWIENIFELRGGHNLTFRIDKEKHKITDFVIYPYWKLDFGGSNNDFSELYKCLERSVAWRLRSDVPVGIMLSGGLDSSCLAAIVSEQSKRAGKSLQEINTFTTCFENYKAGDEREFAHAVNVHCNINENFIYPETEDSFETFKKMVWHYEGECTFRHLGSFLTLQEVSKSGVKVILNGQGSDETMMGYERYYAFYLKEIFRNRKLAEGLKQFFKASCNSRLSVRELLMYYVYFTKPKIRKFRCKARMGKYVTEIVKKNFTENTDIYKHLFFKNPEKLAENEIRGTQLPHILRYEDRSYMAFSLEGRIPFIDYRYVENAMKIPAGLKIRNGYTKYPIRVYLKGKLPEKIVWRKNKMGWPSPAARWVSGFQKEKVKELFKHSYSCQLLNKERIWQLYQKNPASRPVEVFFVLELFMKQFDVRIKGI